MKIWLAASAAGLLACAQYSAIAQPAATNASNEVAVTNSVEGLIDAYASSEQFNGVVRIQRPGETAQTYVRGPADFATGRALTASTRFHIASITKAFTATLVLQLVDRGLVRLDDPISNYVSGLDSEIGARITVRHILSHTSGLPRDYTEALSSEGPYSSTDVISAVNATGLMFEPGRRTAYSNTGYRILADLIERVTGQSYSNALETALLTPLGLTDTRLGQDGSAAIGHDSPDTVTLIPVERVDDSRLPLLGASGIFSTSHDLAHFMNAVVAGDVLSTASRATMLTAMDTENSDGTDGMGWSLYPGPGGGRLIVASGASDGYLSFIATAENAPGHAAVLLTNDTRLGRAGSLPFFSGLMQWTLGGSGGQRAVDTPAATIVRLLDDDRVSDARALLASLDWSNPPVANAAASQATGAPDGGVGETMYAWAPATADAGEEWLSLSWQDVIEVTAIEVHFTQVADALTGIDFGEGERSLDSLDAIEIQSTASAPVHVIRLAEPTQVDEVRLVLDTAAAAGWPQVDAVSVIDRLGTRHWADDARASSSAFDVGAVAMHDLPTQAVLIKLANRLEENNKPVLAERVRALAPHAPI